MYVQGEYGIGKSSIAGFAQAVAERDCGLYAIYASLGGARSLGDVATGVLEATIRSGAFDPKRSERIRSWLGQYIGKQSLFGLTLDFAALKRDEPNLSTPFGMLGFLGEARERLRDTGVVGLFLVLDEINGITGDPQFAHFIKGLVDANAMAKEPLPLLLMLCGVEERRREMIQNHQPIDRIFDVIEIHSLTPEEMREFFERAFGSVQMTVTPVAMSTLVHYSAGFPKIMHMVGDAAYWIDSDGAVDEKDAIAAVLAAADDVGRKYVDQQVYRALQSADYHSILAKIGMISPDRLTFTKEEIESGLTASERGKFNNFLQKMKQLNVIRSGSVRGEYVFNVRMVRLYIWMRSLPPAKAAKE